MTSKILVSVVFALLATSAIAAAPFEGHYRVAGHDGKLTLC